MCIVYVLFTGMEQDLDEFSRSTACENPKLEKLQEIILSFYVENENAQGIVFCKTREMTYALVKWMRDSPLLAVLNPHNITGSNKAEKHGQSVRDVIIIIIIIIIVVVIVVVVVDDVDDDNAVEVCDSYGSEGQRLKLL